MAYAEPSDMSSRFSERYDRFDDRRARVALEDAEAEIDSALGGSYDLPLPPDARPLKSLACDLAWLRMNEDKTPEDVAERAAAARALLGDIAAGRAVLANADGSLVPRADGKPAGGSGAMSTGGRPVMRRSALGGL